MDLTTQITLETNLFMSFEMKNGELHFELDEPEDKNLTFDFYQFPSEIYPEGRRIKVHQSKVVGPIEMKPGKYSFSFNTPKKTQLIVNFKNNKVSFEIVE